VPFNSGVALTMKLINASPVKLLSNLLLLSALAVGVAGIQ
jgi:hypothetical protein